MNVLKIKNASDKFRVGLKMICATFGEDWTKYVGFEMFLNIMIIIWIRFFKIARTHYQLLAKMHIGLLQHPPIY